MQGSLDSKPSKVDWVIDPSWSLGRTIENFTKQNELKRKQDEDTYGANRVVDPLKPYETTR
jgi:hypothetical protein